MSTITSSKTIDILRVVFATHGLPRKVVTDNGPSFTSSEFKSFMQGNGIHPPLPSFHKRVGGERCSNVETGPQTHRRIKDSREVVEAVVTPHSMTGLAPCELLMKRKLRSRLDLIHPDVSKKVESKQEQQKSTHDTKQPIRKFTMVCHLFQKDITII